MNPLLLSAILQIFPMLLGRFFSHAQSAEQMIGSAPGAGAVKMDVTREQVLNDIHELLAANADDPNFSNALADIISEFQIVWPVLVSLFSHFVALGKQSGLIHATNAPAPLVTVSTVPLEPVSADVANG